MSIEKEQLTVSIDRKLKIELKKRAIDEGTTVTKIITELVQEYLEIQK